MPTKKQPTSKLRIIPLGGLGEIGMNCLILEWQDEIVLIDCGIQFPDASRTGVDILLPDLGYLLDKLKKIKGIVITHGHDDHIGAVAYLSQFKKLDVYATPFPSGLIGMRLAEIPNTKHVQFHQIKPLQPFSVGSFRFHPIPVQHSIIESLGFVVETPVGNIVHSGDFKHDPNEYKGQKIGFEPFQEWSKKGVLLLLSDSTNAEKLGHSLSEVDIEESFEKLFSQQKGRMFIALFASNMRRVENLMALAHKQRKFVALAGRSMHSYTRLAHEQSSLSIPEDTLVPLENIHKYSDDRVIILCTGSQAEPQSALVRMAHGTHRDVEIKPGDLILMSSRFIPGNERSITGMINQLYRQGAEVIYESIDQIHVSGHGCSEELLMMLNATKPRFFIPVHGEYRHLCRHASLAKESGVHEKNIQVIEDGQVITLDEDSMTLAEKLELHKTAVADGMILEGSQTIFTQRGNLAKTGVVHAALVRDKKRKKLLTHPIIAPYALLYQKGEDPEALIEEAADLISDVYHAATSRDDLNELIRVEIRRFFKKYCSHKPVVHVTIVEI